MRRKKGEELQSSFLVADSFHTKSDIFVSFSVLGSLLFVKLGWNIVDPLLALIIGFLIAKMGYRISKDSAMILTDASLIECENEVREILHNIEGVRGYHKFRCRGKPGEMYAEVHILVNPSLSVREAHEISEEVEKQVTEKKIHKGNHGARGTGKN